MRLVAIHQIFVVGEEGDRVFSALEILLPVIESVYDGEQFLIIHVIILLCRSKGLRKVCTGMEVTIFISLHKYSPADKERGISHDNKRAIDIREAENWGSLEFLEEDVKGSLVYRVPTAWLIFMRESSEEGNNIREARDEFAIEIAKAQERVDCFYCF